MDNQKAAKKLKNIMALFTGIFFAAVISEIILQIIDFPERPVSGWLNCGKTNPGECNNMGFRGREFAYSDDDFVVILLGDSELYAPMIPFEQRSENRLEHFLRYYRDNVKVFTIADMGYGQDQQYLALKKYFDKYRADLVLLMFTVRNDIEDNIFPVAGLNNTIKPTFWFENNEFRGPTEEWLEPVGSRSKFGLLWMRFSGETIGKTRLIKWRKEILPRAYQGLSQYEGDVDYSWQEQSRKSPQNAFNSLEYEKAGHAGTELTPRSELRMYGINLTRKLFYEIKHLTEANNGNFILFKEERPWEMHYTDKEKVYYLNGRYYKLSVRQHHETLNDLFKGFENYRIPLTMDNHTVSIKDEHLSPQAINNLMKDLSLIVSVKEYFKQ